MNEEIKKAVEEIKSAFPSSAVRTEDLDGCGVCVTIGPLNPGALYEQNEVCIMFEITGAYPAADIYPIFVIPKLTRSDGQNYRDGLSKTKFKEQDVTQISRRIRSGDLTYETAGFKVKRVWEWTKRQQVM